MVFNKAGRLYRNSNYYINNIELEILREYKYLGILRLNQWEILGSD